MEIPITTVTFTDNGVRPSGFTIKKGGRINFVNKSSRLVAPTSDPYDGPPKNAELNTGVINPDVSEEVTITRKGVWGMHNHLDQTEKFDVTVD